MLLGKTLQEVQRGTTSSEFAQWRAFLEKDLKEPTREEIYLAQIAAEVAKAGFNRPRRYRTEDFILKFELKGAEPERSSIETSKAYWMTLAMHGAQRPPPKKG